MKTIGSWVFKAAPLCLSFLLVHCSSSDQQQQELDQDQQEAAQGDQQEYDQQDGDDNYGQQQGNYEGEEDDQEGNYGQQVADNPLANAAGQAAGYQDAGYQQVAEQQNTGLNGTQQVDQYQANPGMNPAMNASGYQASGAGNIPMGEYGDPSMRVVRFVVDDGATILSGPGGQPVGQLDRGDAVMVTIEGEYAKIVDGRYIASASLSEMAVARTPSDNPWQ